MAIFSKHEGCPKCGSRDNLARYEDGSAWCFGCRYWEPPTEVPWSRLPAAASFTSSEEIKGSPEEKLTDTTKTFPRHVLEWLFSYGISAEEALRFDWLYSPRWDQLLFPLKDERGTTVCVQARNFNPQRKSKAKYYNKGEKSAHWTIFLPSVSNTNGSTGTDGLLVLTEDILSAAKVGLSTPAMPLLGVHIGRDKLKRLRGFYSSLIVWLDSDKWREARDIAEAAKFLGFEASTLLTEHDPKEYSKEQIMEFLK
jgi:hypothetical protein